MGWEHGAAGARAAVACAMEGLQELCARRLRLCCSGDVGSVALPLPQHPPSLPHPPAPRLSWGRKSRQCPSRDGSGQEWLQEGPAQDLPGSAWAEAGSQPRAALKPPSQEASQEASQAPAGLACLPATPSPLARPGGWVPNGQGVWVLEQPRCC